MKKILFALLAVAVLASSLVVSTSAAEIPTDGLIGNYHFEGDLVNSVDGTSGTPMCDKFAEPLYEIDDPDRYWFTGVEGNAFYCADGDGAQLVSPGEADWTVGMWIIETAITGIHPYMWYGQQLSQSPENWLGIWNVSIDDNVDPWNNYGLSVGSNDSNGARLGIVPTEAALYDTEGEIALQWTHVVLTAVLDAEANTYTITMYVDGEDVGSASGFPNPATGDPETNGDFIYINGVNFWADPNSSGAIDELVVYNRALSADEVATLYGAYAAPKTYATLDEWNNDIVELSGDEPDDTDPVDEPDDTDPVDEPEDTEPQDTPPTTDTEPVEEGGCGSAMGAAAAIVALVSILGCAIIKKH